MQRDARPDKTDELWVAAQDALSEYDSRRAMALGKKLVRLRHSSGWEVMGRAYLLMDRPDKAIAALERGLRLAPEAGALWITLGCCHDDAGNWGASERCFRRALACRHTDANSAWLNLGAMLVRAGQPAEAMAALACLSDEAEPEQRLFAQVHRLAALNSAERWADCMAEARALLPAVPAESDPDLLGHALGQYALALARSAADAAEVRGAALQALSHRRVEPAALEALRLLRGVRSPANYTWLISLEGTPAHFSVAREGPLGFFTAYEVIADREALAVELAQELEHESNPEPLRVERVTRLGAMPNHLQGVVGRHGYILFDREAGPRRALWQRLLRRQAR